MSSSMVISMEYISRCIVWNETELKWRKTLNEWAISKMATQKRIAVQVHFTHIDWLNARTHTLMLQFLFQLRLTSFECVFVCTYTCVCVFLCYFFLALISWVLRGVLINSCFIFISLLIDHTLINECKRFSPHLLISLLNTRLSDIVHILAPSATLIHPFALAPLNYEHSSFYQFLLDSCCVYSACGIVCVSYAIYVYVCVLCVCMKKIDVYTQVTAYAHSETAPSVSMHSMKLSVQIDRIQKFHMFASGKHRHIHKG